MDDRIATSAPTSASVAEDATVNRHLSELAKKYQRQVRSYWPRYRTYARQGRQLGNRYNLAGRQLKSKLAGGTWKLDQKSSLGLMILPIETGLLISRHLLAFLEDLLAIGEHRLGLREADREKTNHPLPTLSLSASPGEKVESVFLIQNDREYPVSIELQPQSIVGKESGPCNSCELDFSPQATTLPAGANQMIRLTTQVSEDTTEDIYHTRINILGLENKAFCIQLQVFSKN